MSLFVTKYQPTSKEDLKGQQTAVSNLYNFIQTYKQQRHKAAILHGPIGNGKTSSVYALAKELNYDLLEINSSDLRNADSIKSFLGSALGQQSLFMRPKIILIDEIDNVSGRKDRGCIPAIIKAIQKSSFPVILTANDIEDSKYKGLKKVCELIPYHKLQYKTISNYLQDICQKENIQFEEKALNSLARQADGDMRAALLDLQTSSFNNNITFQTVTELSQRKRTETILNALTIIFKSSTAQNALRAFDDLDLDLRDAIFWIDNNLPREYTTPTSIAKAYEYLSRVDVFNGRISNRQHWRFLVYMSNLLTAGVSISKEQRNPNFISYKPTMRFLNIWQYKMKNAKKKEIVRKLAQKTHTSQKVAREQIPYLKVMFKSNYANTLAHELDLTDDEIGWLKK